MDVTPARRMSILIVCSDRSEGAVLKMSLLDALAAHVHSIEVIDDVRLGFLHFVQNHPDVVLTLGLKSEYSEALAIRIRKADGDRHTGILVMAPVTENYDRLAEENFFAGVDDVVSSNLSAIILKSKIVTVFNLKFATDNLRSAVHKLEALTLTDELTGLANMRGFLKRFEQTLNEQAGKGLALLMMDLDHFKRVNDTMNHMVGSHLIKSVGRILARNSVFGAKDFAARYGGDEFIAVMVGERPETLLHQANLIRSMIEGSVFEFQGFKASVTASIGLCWVDSCRAVAPENIVKAADAMLYRSKEAGRNRVTGCKMMAEKDFDFNSPDLLNAPMSAMKKAG